MSDRVRRHLKVLLVLALASAALPAGRATAAQPLSVSFHRYTSTADFTASGTQSEGTVIAPAGDALTMGTDTSPFTYTDPYDGETATYDSARWTSPSFTPGFPFGELVASWNADTPAGTWLQVEMQATTDKGATTKWYVMGRWSFDDSTVHRTSVGGQGDADGYVAIDTFIAKDKPMTDYRLRVTLYALPGASAPTLRSIGALASNMPNANPYVASSVGGAEGTELAVPAFSQEIHSGEYPQFDGGGEAWCSPTSTSMIVAYWGQGPSASDYGYVGNDYPNVVDPWVDYAARHTDDYHYQGAGNWPFNAAYAAHYGLDAFVTQLRSLNEAERFIKAGIPLVASIALNPNELTGFLLDKGTNGHLLTIVGFDKQGNVISNDPAATSDSTVRHVYNRAQFEKAWLSSTGGIVYVIHPESVSLPPLAVPSQPNW